MSERDAFRRPLPEATDELEEQMLGNIERIGWQVMGILGDESGPGFAYSVGLYHTFEHPELVLFGLPHELMQVMINLAGEEIRKGKLYQDWHEEDGLLEGYRVCFRNVPKTQYRDYLGYARWLYHGDDFPVLQCIWPDKLHHYPWHRDSSEAFQERQPLVCEKDDWPFLEGKNTAAFTCRSVFSEGKPILRVCHEEDGAWQFLTDEAVSEADLMIVGLGTVFDHDPSVAEVADLPEGQSARRVTVGGEWK